MDGQVIEVLATGTYVSQKRGFMCIKNDSSNIDAKIPLDDISVLIMGQGTSISTGLINSLTGHGAAVVIAGTNYHPIAYFWPQSSHGAYVKRLRLQIEASLPLKKRLWQLVVQCKILQQSAVLLNLHTNDAGLGKLAMRVRSGDPDNLEAYAARKYWPLLFGESFRRNTDGTDLADPNIFLNYGYAVIRAAMARSLAAVGLTPALGIHHRNLENPFCLVDDLMEPYRPLVDLAVFDLIQNDKMDQLCPTAKKKLAGLLEVRVTSSQEESCSISASMNQVAISFCKSLQSGTPQIHYPTSIIPCGQLA